jgi:hypothetical protein
MTAVRVRPERAAWVFSSASSASSIRIVVRMHQTVRSMRQGVKDERAGLGRPRPPAPSPARRWSAAMVPTAVAVARTGRGRASAG